MSAPPGWHPQPDGRERWWDGQQWTEHFRDPDPVGGAETAAETSVYPATGYQDQGGYQAPAQGGYQTPAGYQGGYQGYGQPGSQWQQPEKKGMSRGAKGCLIAAIVIVVLLIVGAVLAVFLFARSVDRAVDDVRSSMPTATSDDGSGSPETVVVVVGQGFDVGNAQVSDGWSVDDGGTFGREVTGMQATTDGTSTGLPPVFTMVFTGTDGNDVETVCTAGSESGTSDVTCVPLFEDIDEDGDVRVTPTF